MAALPHRAMLEVRRIARLGMHEGRVHEVVLPRDSGSFCERPR
jgi:hypothetical protein